MKSTPFEQPRTRAVFLSSFIFRLSSAQGRARILSSFIFRLSSAHWRALVLAPCLLHPVPARGLLLAAFALLLASCSEPETGLTGTIEYDEVQLSATAFETVVELNVDEGTVVAPGDRVAQLDATNRELALAEAQAAYEAALAGQRLVESGTRVEQIDQAQAQVGEISSRLVEAERELDRQQSLRERGLTAEGAVDTALAQRNSAAASLEQARARLAELRAGSRLEEIEEARAQSALSAAQVDSARRRVEELTILSPVAGVVDSVPVEQGDRVQQGQVIARILKGQPFVRFYLPQDERAGVAVGDTIQIRMDGTDEDFSARVRFISQDATFTPFFALNERDRGYLTYLAEAEIQSEAALPAGFPAQVFLHE